MALNCDACAVLAKHLTFPELVRVACACKGLWNASEEVRTAGKKEFLIPRSIAREIALWLQAEYAKHRVACIVAQNVPRDGFRLIYDDVGTESDYRESWDPYMLRFAEINLSVQTRTVVVHISTVKRSAPVLHTGERTFMQHPTLQSMRKALAFHVEFNLATNAYSRGNAIPRELPSHGTFDSVLSKLQELNPLV